MRLLESVPFFQVGQKLATLRMPYLAVRQLTEQIRRLDDHGRDYLFAGSHDAARRAAAVYSLTRACVRYGVPAFAYSADVLPKIANGWDRKRLDELPPHHWRSSAPGPSSPSGP